MFKHFHLVLKFRLFLLLLVSITLTGCVTQLTKPELENVASAYVDETLGKCLKREDYNKSNRYDKKVKRYLVNCSGEYYLEKKNRYGRPIHLIYKDIYLPFRKPKDHGLSREQVFTAMHEQILKKFRVVEYKNDWMYETKREKKIRRALYSLENRFYIGLGVYTRTYPTAQRIKIWYGGYSKNKVPIYDELIGVPQAKHEKSDRFAENKKRWFKNRVKKRTAKYKRENVDAEIARKQIAKANAEYDRKHSKSLWGAAMQGFSQGLSEGMNDWNQQEQARQKARKKADIERAARKIGVSGNDKVVTIGSGNGIKSNNSRSGSNVASTKRVYHKMISCLAIIDKNAIPLKHAMYYSQIFVSKDNPDDFIKKAPAMRRKAHNQVTSQFGIKTPLSNCRVNGLGASLTTAKQGREQILRGSYITKRVNFSFSK